MRSPLAQYFILGIVPLIHQTRIDQRQEYDPVSALLFAVMPTPSNSWKVNRLLGGDDAHWRSGWTFRRLDKTDPLLRERGASEPRGQGRQRLPDL